MECDGKEVKLNAIGPAAVKWLMRKGWLKKKRANNRTVYFMTAEGIQILKSIGLNPKGAYK